MVVDAFAPTFLSTFGGSAVDPGPSFFPGPPFTLTKGSVDD